MPSRNLLRYGRDAALPAQFPLRAGPLTMIFAEGGLRYLRVDGREAVRGIYVAVRDANWRTVPSRISNFKLKQEERSFELTFDVENREGPIDFRWSAWISGSERGALVFTMRGKAASSFRRNRIGFCVLHPVPECAGQPCRVEHTGGSVETGVFPLHISPNQPFVDMRAISHEVQPGRRVEVRFEGDVFEMEDQRNWTDASYKTYCTPLSRPFPVEIPAGAEIAQDIRVTVTPPAASVAVQAAKDETVRFRVGRESRPLPALGVAVASHGRQITPAEQKRLAALRLAHLRVDLDLASSGNAALLKTAAAAGLPLEAALFLGADPAAELERLAKDLDEIRPPVARWLVFHKAEKSTGRKWVEMARAQLGGYASLPFAGGTNAYFAELNRGRPEPSGLDGVCFSINPQVHAFDNDSLVETLGAQAAAVATARQFVGALPVHVTPVTLKPRFNPDATSAAAGAPVGELPPEVDERQMSLLGAGWSLGSLKYLAEAGAASVTWYETTGWRGVMERAEGSPAPRRFPSIPGSVFPLYHVLADAGEFRGGDIVLSSSSEPLHIDGAVLRSGSRVAILITNFRPVGRTVRIEGVDLQAGWTLRALDETNAETAMRAPEAFRNRAAVPVEVSSGGLELRLEPYAVARLDNTKRGLA